MSRELFNSESGPKMTKIWGQGHSNYRFPMILGLVGATGTSGQTRFFVSFKASRRLVSSVLRDAHGQIIRR